MAPPRSSKRQQTKLSFSPKSSTSKYANVTYEGSPAKKRKTNGGQQQLLLDATFRSDGPSSSTANAASEPLSPLRSSQYLRRDNLDDSDKELGEDGTAVSDETDSDDSVPNLERKSKTDEPLSTSVFTRAPIISPRPKEKPKLDREVRRKESKHVSKQQILPNMPSSDLGSDEDLTHTTPCKSRATRAVLISDDSEDVMPTTQRQRTTVQILSDSDSDEQPATQRRKARSLPIVPANDNGQEQSEDSDAPIKTPSRQRRKLQRPVEESSEDEDDEPATPMRQQRRKRRSSSEDAEAAELAADAKELKRSTVFKKEKVGRLRDRAGNSKVNDRRSRLEQLKAQREGWTIEISDDEEDDNGEDDEEYADDQQVSEEAEEEANWISDDDEAARGLDEIGTNADMLPLEMMRHGQRSLKEHFLYVVKWMVASRYNPAEAEELKELYELSTRRVNREAQGLTDRLISSSWVAKFVYILKARPEYEEMEIGASGFDSDKCAACNRSGHPAKYLVKLKGKAYNRKKLEPLKDEDDEDEGEDTSEDEGGHKLVSEDREWYLGSFCRSNAINAHSLLHWQIHLRDWLAIYMEAQGYNKVEEVVKRDSWSQKKRRRFVEGIMDDLETSKQIKSLWRDLQDKLKAAPDVMGQKGWR